MGSTTQAMKNYFGISEEYSSQENSRVAIVPVPYEHTVSYGVGTSLAPDAILEASHQVELFDDELWIEPYKVGIHTAEPVKMEPVDGDTEDPFNELKAAITPIIEFNKFPIIIGGEHSLTLGAVKACIDRYPDLSILQIDAHADCRDSYEGNPYSHASVSYHLYKALPQPLITQVGIRNISSGEVEWMEREKPRINIFWARHQDKWNFNEIINTLSDNVYLTIDGRHDVVSTHGVDQTALHQEKRRRRRHRGIRTHSESPRTELPRSQTDLQTDRLPLRPRPGRLEEVPLGL
jgi:agmatinase